MGGVPPERNARSIHAVVSLAFVALQRNSAPENIKAIALSTRLSLQGEAPPLYSIG